MVDTATISGLLSVKFMRLPEEVAAGLALSIIEKGAFEMPQSLKELEIGFLLVSVGDNNVAVLDQYKDAFLNALIDRSGDSLAGNQHTRAAIKGILMGMSTYSIREMYVCIENGSVRPHSVPLPLKGYFNHPRNNNDTCTVKPIYRSLLLRT